MPNRIGYHRALNRDKWRDNISAAKRLSTLEKIQDELAANWRILTGEQVAALRLLTDIQFRMLAKVLPDLKAVELRAEVTQPQSWSPMQLVAADLARLSATFEYGNSRSLSSQEQAGCSTPESTVPAEPPALRLLR